jgi:hypothetical protein
MVSSKVNMIAIILFILNRTRRTTTGWSKMARMVAKTRGTIMPLAMYSIANKAYRPMRNKAALA